MSQSRWHRGGLADRAPVSRLRGLPGDRLQQEDENEAAKGFVQWIPHRENTQKEYRAGDAHEYPNRLSHTTPPLTVEMK